MGTPESQGRWLTVLLPLVVVLVLVCLVGPACPGSSKDGPLEVAQAQFQRKDYAAVLRGLTPLLSAPGASKELLVLAVRAAIRARETARARELAKRLLSHPGAGADGPYYAGMVESSAGAFEKALALFAKAPGHEGAKRETVRALCHLGRGAMRRRDLSAARQLMERARQVDPESPLVDRNLGLIALRSGRPAQAVGPLRRALDHAPTDPVANRLMGRALAAMGKLEQAEHHLEQAVAAGHALDPAAQARTLMDAGVVRARLGKPFNAMVDLTQAVNVLGHDHPKLLVQVQARLARTQVALGLQQLDGGRVPEALRSFRGALAASARLSRAERAEVQSAIVVGAAVRGQLEQARRLLRGGEVDLRPILRAAYAPIAAGLLDAYADYSARDAGRRLRAAASFEQMAEKVAAPAREKLLEMAVRSRLRAAELLFEKGAIAEARKVHQEALKGLKDPPPVWRHNAAVLDYAAGERASAIAALKQLTAEVPLAACNLAVDSELAYVPWEAYRLFKECKARGGHFPGLEKTLSSKVRGFEEGRE